MYHNNSSSSSLVSRQSFASLKKDKELPPIPPIAQPVIATGPEDPILQAKTLKRKNFKQLSLSATSSSSLQALILTLALGLTLGLALNLALATQVEAPDTISDLSGYAEKRNRHRPEKLVNFSLDGNITANSTANSTASGKNPSSPSVVACQLSGLELNKCHTSASQTSLQLHLSSTSSVNAASSNGIAASIGASTASGTTHTQYVSRKRQTVISSISPTKSITSIPSSISSANSASAHKLSFNIEASPLMEDVSLPLLTTSQLRLNNNDLITLKELGAGNSGTVSKILHVPSQRIMAKKIIHIDLKSMVQTQIIRELRILHECRSPYIVEFYGAFINNNNTIVMCMEYCNCGSLDKILQLCDNGQFPNPVLKKLTYVMLSGLTYLFKTHKIVHRDIKPQNVLMNHKGEFKLCDFGVSRELKTLGMADTFVGTSYYMSPERIQGGNYGIKSDVWSIGIMLYELACGRHVWNDEDDEVEGDEEGDGDKETSDSMRCPEGILDLLQRIVNEKPPTLTNKKNPKTKEPYDPQLCDLIDSCLIKDDVLRKAPWDVLDHNYMFGVDNGVFDKEVKNWAKKIRKQHKEK